MRKGILMGAGFPLLALAVISFVPDTSLLSSSLEDDLRGKWIIESTGDDITGGHILFQESGTYEFFRRYPDGTGAGTKGGYKLQTEGSLGFLRLCLGDCGAAGSEWTSSFSLVQLTDEGKLEIFFSPDGNYPREFPKTKDEQGMYVFARE